jgi:hypothetical protein
MVIRNLSKLIAGILLVTPILASSTPQSTEENIAEGVYEFLLAEIAAQRNIEFQYPSDTVPKEFVLEYRTGYELALLPYPCLEQPEQASDKFASTIIPDAPPEFWYAEVRDLEGGRSAHGCWIKRRFKQAEVVFTQIIIPEGDGKAYLDFRNETKEFTARY